jgi:YD repeat-containing protein
MAGIIPAAGSGSSGGDGTGCSNCPPAGMPVWEVSEPYINVWLYDEPLGYQPGLGGRISFKLAYKQRESRTIYTNFFSLGKMWDCSWLSYVLDDGFGNTADMAVSGGGARTYTPDGSTVEYLSHTKLLRTTGGTGQLTGFTASYPSGAKDYYQDIPGYGGLIEAEVPAFLSYRADPSGRITSRYIYEQPLVSPQNIRIFRLKYVVDSDSRTNTLLYTNAAFPAQITGVIDPFGRQTILKYDPAGMLTNVTDVASLPSSFSYDQQGWLTNLTTPYGPTTFQYATNSDTSSGNEFGQFSETNNPFVAIRSVKIVDPVGGLNVYMLRQDSSWIYTNAMDFYTNRYASGTAFLPSSYDPSVVPSGTPTPTGSYAPELDASANLQYRNSFHWGPRQAAALLAADLHSVHVLRMKALSLRCRRMRSSTSSGLIGLIPGISDGSPCP